MSKVVEAQVKTAFKSAMGSRLEKPYTSKPIMGKDVSGLTYAASFDVNGDRSAQEMAGNKILESARKAAGEDAKFVLEKGAQIGGGTDQLTFYWNDALNTELAAQLVAGAVPDKKK